MCAAVYSIPEGQNLNRCFKNWIAFDNLIWRGGFLVGKVIRAQVREGGNEHEVYGIQGP